MQQFERSFSFDFKKEEEDSDHSFIGIMGIAIAVTGIIIICIIGGITAYNSNQPKTDISNIHSQPQIQFLKSQLEDNLAEHGDFLYGKNNQQDVHLNIITTLENKEKSFGCQIKAKDIVSSAFASDVNKACNNAAFNFNGLIHEGEQKYIKSQMEITNKKLAHK